MNAPEKPTIIGIMPHGPSYGFAPGEKPEVCWEKADGSLVGFWPREWLDFLGEEILKVTDRYAWEVWQPDYRADRIYSRLLDTGVMHRLFPAEEKLYRPGVRTQKDFYSKSMLSRLDELKNRNIILMLYNTYGFRSPFQNEILRAFGPGKRFPVFFRGGGQFKAPLSEIPGLHRPLTYLDLLVEHWRLKKLVPHVDVITEQSESALNEVRKIYQGRIERLTLGCDFDFWIPVPSAERKLSVRNRLNIPHRKLVFFASGNFMPVKQFDRLLEVFEGLQNRDEFFLIIAGHGNKTCTDTLFSLSEPLARQGKAVIHPFVTGEGLRDLYWASDVYISVSVNEGGPVSVMKAMGCGLPVLSTPVGETADRMREHGAGKFVPVKNYGKWSKAVLEILEGDIPAPLNRAVAEKAYHWTNVANRYVGIFDDLRERRY